MPMSTKTKVAIGCAGLGCLLPLAFIINASIFSVFFGVDSTPTPNPNTRVSAPYYPTETPRPVRPATRPARPQSRPTPTVSADVLEASNIKARREHGHIIITGKVKNLTPHALEDVLVEAHLYTYKGGDVVTIQDSLIDYSPLMPGQSSTWEIYAADSSDIHDAVISFKHVLGRQLSARGWPDVHIK
jgi:hypothetical protein